MAAAETVRIVVRGRVQGVGFRFYTVELAHRYGVTGWVRNLPGGEVELLVRLPAGVREAFLAELREGPPLSRVQGVRVLPAGADDELPASGFRVRH